MPRYLVVISFRCPNPDCGTHHDAIDGDAETFAEVARDIERGAVETGLTLISLSIAQLPTDTPTEEHIHALN